MIRVRRLGDGPIVRPFAERRMGGNVNGPSLIRTPDWLAGRLGRYHLYFAHHLGTYIRLAYADALEGPWEIYAPGVLDVAQCLPFFEHVASPDVHVDHARQELRMYVHGITSAEPREDPAQSTCLALSFDGLHFALRPQLLGGSYFRVWTWEGWHYALSLGGRLWRSVDGIAAFERGPVLPGLPKGNRHSAVLRRDGRLWVAWSTIGDCPERLFLGAVDLTPDWGDWRLVEAREILRPQSDWDGAGYAPAPSVAGAALTPVNQLRDPAFFCDAGQDYLVYSVAGEAGLAIAEIDGLM